MGLVSCSDCHAHATTIRGQWPALDSACSGERNASHLRREATHLLLAGWESLIIEQCEDSFLAH